MDRRVRPFDEYHRRSNSLYDHTDHSQHSEQNLALDDVFQFYERLGDIAPLLLPAHAPNILS